MMIPNGPERPPYPHFLSVSVCQRTVTALSLFSGVTRRRCVGPGAWGPAGRFLLAGSHSEVLVGYRPGGVDARVEPWPNGTLDIVGKTP